MMRAAMTLVLALIGVLVLLAIAGQVDIEAEDFDSARYCDMVYQHKLDKTKGWPDYEGVYDQQCVKGELRKP